MHYFVGILLIVLSIDGLRSYIILKRVANEFYRNNSQKSQPTTLTFGQGKAFHLVILGDSTFDVRADAKITLGPAQVIVKELAKHHKVHVNLLAKAGAKSYDVVEQQLPALKKLTQVDLIIVYMGANNAVYLKSPWQVGKDYNQLLDLTENRGIPIIASEVANYWYLGIFSWLHRLWLYVSVHIENKRIRAAFTGRTRAVLLPIKQIHRDIHRNRRTKPYLSDGFHPNDAINVVWGNLLLELAKNNPNTKDVFIS